MIDQIPALLMNKDAPSDVFEATNVASVELIVRTTVLKFSVFATIVVEAGTPLTRRQLESGVRGHVRTLRDGLPALPQTSSV
jgi:hypothetical protein